MSTSSQSERLRKKLHLKEYLGELGRLLGRVVQEEELGSLAQVTTIRAAALKFDTQPAISHDIPFTERKSDRFVRFIQCLSEANPSHVYVWTPRTILCGVILVPSLNAIKLDFDFDINHEGVLVFLTSDLSDRLLLDFSTTDMNEQRLNIELQGRYWSRVSY